MHPIHAALLLTLLVLPACGREPADARDPGADLTEVEQVLQEQRDAQSQHVMSSAGDLVAFVHSTPELLVPSDYGLADPDDPRARREEATEIWTCKPDGSDAQLRLRGKAGFCRFHNLQFSPDGKQLYFLCSGWVTSHQVQCLDLASGESRYVCPGNALEVILHGPHSGQLIVTQHRYYPMGGSYDWPWLFTPEGKCLGPVRRGPDGGVAASVLGMCMERPARSAPATAAQAGRTGG